MSGDVESYYYYMSSSINACMHHKVVTYGGVCEGNDGCHEPYWNQTGDIQLYISLK